ncbi:MAG: hypothetical protein LR017_03970 [Candidatus Pacebacteria bacterium]|nr:hypothetical protein [Candidatus Paceibacterota bacterium]
MQELGPVIALLAIVIIFIVAGGEGGVLQTNTNAPLAPASTQTTPTTDQDTIARSATISSPASVEPTTQAPATPAPEPLSDTEIESRLVTLYRELDTLEEKTRQATLREPRSPYAAMVSLRTSSVRTTDPSREYLTLKAQSDNAGGVTISDWYLESYVTETRAALPEGSRLLEHLQTKDTEPIVLLPGEQAYLITGEPALRVSFHENHCSGYLTQYEDFYPSLTRRCPRPFDEMERFADIKLDDDSCYDYIERMRSCTVIKELSRDTKDTLSSRCEKLLENHFTYNSCVEHHKNDPFFEDVGGWYVYLDRDEELWRYEREIIRLMDEHDRVIAVIEY